MKAKTVVERREAWAFIGYDGKFSYFICALYMRDIGAKSFEKHGEEIIFYG